MKRYFPLTLAIALGSPVLWAQLPPPAAPATPATPATPASPATPATPAAPPDQTPPDVKATPPSDSHPNGSASVHKGRNSVGATGTPGTQSGKARLRSENGNDFGFLDVDGDGAISKDEAKGNAELSGEFDQLDKNSDGRISKPELAAGVHGTPNKGGGRS